MTDVLLATCASLPDGEPGHDVLDDEFRRRGTSARWASWDDDGVDWAEARVVALRSTWDYESRLPEFLAWTRRVEATGVVLLNGAAAFAWNVDKKYLLDLADLGVPVVPTVLVSDHHDVAGAVERFGTAVVKPRTAAGGRGLSVVADPADWGPHASAGPWIGQPDVESIRTEGEQSVFVLGGRAVSQVAKVAGPDDLRVHERHGGSSKVVGVDDAAEGVALGAVRAAERLLGVGLSYARVDLMRLDGELVVGEVELTEPSLYLDLVPDNARFFVDAVLAGARSPDPGTSRISPGTCSARSPR